MFITYMYNIIIKIKNVTLTPWRDTYQYISRLIDNGIDRALDDANEYRGTRKIKKRNRIGSHSKRKILYLMSALTMAHTVKASERHTEFDTDSVVIGVDNKSSYCISTFVKDFVGPLRKCKRVIKGFMGSLTHTLYIGTLKWRWDDDTGKTHTFLIPNSFYIPDYEQRLLSPQNWAQMQRDTYLIAGAGEITTGKEVALFWNQRICKRINTIVF